ncbi:Inositol monophosphatase family protein [Prunus dulcis]|uniref:Inositol monophosphatase family protein n=1 Tax=Prunus dulcis TaxID=3755 RepID=A0A4Y1R9J9_PRUDU|nr:Inositol monophosphatase family protein [Prunus dulcis]
MAGFSLHQPPFNNCLTQPIQPTVLPAMILVHSARHFSTVRFSQPDPAVRRLRFSVRSSLPFGTEKAKYHRELEAAVDAVERACALCVEVQSSLLSSKRRVVEKNDQTPVTVADFGVQALLSLELGKRFPSIPLVAEEDSAFVRSNNLVGSVFDAVISKSSHGENPWTPDHVLEAIDRGGQDGSTFGAQPATYWLNIIAFQNELRSIMQVLDPIDGTQGFVKGNQALYVVGLALVIDGQIVLGVMGCPNWQNAVSNKSTSEVQEEKNTPPGSGIIMVAHTGCGTWTKRLSSVLNLTAKMPYSWTQCFVDECCVVEEARYSIRASDAWESYPLSTLFTSTTSADSIVEGQILLVKSCCGSLSKYIMVASGRVSLYMQNVKVQKVTKAWDHAAGIICVYEAGGKVTDWKGDQINLAADQLGRRNIYPSGGILVTNGNLHNRLVEMISSNSSTVSR